MKLNSTYMLLISVALIGGCLHQAMAFSVGPAGRCRPSLSTPTSTCLFSEDEGAAGEQVPQEQETAQNNNNNSNDSSSTDILNSPAFLKRKVDVLKSDIAKVEEDIAAAKQRLEEGKAEWGGQLDDLQKEYQNIQSRLNNQSKKGGSMATVQVAREILKVLDNFDRAFGVIKAETDTQKAIEQEYRATYDEILKMLNDLGVEEVDTVGTEFDYEVHQAVMQRPSDEFEEGTVCEELQKGFKLNDTLIRAAMVVVAV